MGQITFSFYIIIKIIIKRVNKNKFILNYLLTFVVGDDIIILAPHRSGGAKGLDKTEQQELSAKRLETVFSKKQV